MYFIDLNNIVPHKNLTCLVAKASADESMLWHRRLGHLNFKTMNKLVRNNLVKGLPSKCFENDNTCVACLKGKQHKASCKTKLVNSVSNPLQTLHVDLFGPTSVSSLNHKCLKTHSEMEQPNLTFAKILILDTGKFEQWKFRIQRYLQNEHYALWEVIEFGDSYQAPPEETGKGSASESFTKKKGRTFTITIEDMQKRRNDVKARTTLLLALPDEHQLRFSKYKTAQELWGEILKTFGGNEATKKTKKNQLKQQYGNFKAEGSETLEQTFSRLQGIVSHLKFIDVEIEQDDLNHKFFTSLALEWLMYTIVWRNVDDLDTMSLDDVYNQLKVYESEVQKKSETNSQNMAFISSSNTSSGKGKVHTAIVLTASIQVSTASTQVSTASTDVAAASISHDTVCAYIASQSNGSQIKYEDITQIDEDDIEEIDIKECRAPRSQDRGKKESYRKGPKEEEQTPKALMAIDGIGRDWSYMANEEENHALVADEEIPTDVALTAKSSSSSKNKVYDDSFCSKSCRKNTENLNTKITKLNEELSDINIVVELFMQLPCILFIYFNLLLFLQRLRLFYHYSFSLILGLGISREKAEKELEANIALIETWDDVRAKINANHQLAERLQAEEQQELTDEEKAILFMHFLEKRRKFFAAKRAKEKRNKPPTQAQKIKIIAFKRVNTFKPIRSELVEGKEKRAGEELIQKRSKKQKVDDDKETSELKKLMEIIPKEEKVAIDAIPLAVKSSGIVDWKIYKEGKKSYY
uniref:Ribonuclease H-like domain-containing protein n=1 Tax=Tanacetum cinerariifolium TaxID=118510 RepID=A0A6L2M083_TANCI|nr:ribonuclease H-like domain-containing protein [Tanacetum cinerariifolium]